MAETGVLEGPGNDAVVSAPRKFRVQLDFDVEDFGEINDLVKGMRLPTRAELFRSALITLRWMYQKKRQGYSIVAMSPDHQRLIEPEFTFLERVRAQKKTIDEEDAVAAS